MSPDSAVERYMGSVDYEARLRGSPIPQQTRRPAITISRQAGSGAHVVAEELIRRLQAQSPEDQPPWTVFDRNLVEQVLKEHELPERLAEYMPEDRVSEIADTIDELFGLHPSAWTLVRKTAETILHLIEIGNVVVIGRGANILSDRVAHVLHVRLVGSVTRRIEHVQHYLHLDAAAAAEYVRSNDLGRKRYVRKYYDADIDDPLLYHLVINTDLIPYAEAASVIADVVRSRADAWAATATP